MQKKLFIISIHILLFIFLPINSNAQNLQEIISRHHKKIGKEKLDQVNTIISKGHISQFDSKMEFTQYQKRPNKFRLESHIDQLTMIQLTDGESGYTYAPWTSDQGIVKLTDFQVEQLNESTSIDGWISYFFLNNYEFTFAGIDESDGKKSYVFKVGKSPRRIIFIFIDQKEFTLHRIYSVILFENKKLETETFYDDFRLTEGILLPYKITTSYNGEISMVAHIKSYTFNASIDDKLFKKESIIIGQE